VLCREEGLALSELAANPDLPLAGFGLFGIVKETGVDDQGLFDFTSFFSFPLYKDVNLDYYKALGNRKLSLPWNPWTLLKGFFYVRGIGKRLKTKNIEGNLIGEGLTKGGVIIFGKDKKAKYAYAEETGEEIPLEDILAAVEAVKRGM